MLIGANAHSTADLDYNSRNHVSTFRESYIVDLTRGAYPWLETGSFSGGG